MKLRVLVLGAGFGGLELSSILSEELGACYIEFGAERVGRVEVEFLAGPPTGIFTEPSLELVADKQHFGSSRSARWFGL